MEKQTKKEEAAQRNLESAFRKMRRDFSLDLKTMYGQWIGCEIKEKWCVVLTATEIRALVDNGATSSYYCGMELSIKHGFSNSDYFCFDMPEELEKKYLNYIKDREIIENMDIYD